MKREYYSSSISDFLKSNKNEILGQLTESSDFDLGQDQRDAWIEEISILQEVLVNYSGSIYFEYSIPRMGKRIDVVLIIKSVIFIFEFKIGSKEFSSSAVDQVWDYSLDLKNFHSSSRDHFMIPVIIATKAKAVDFVLTLTPQNDKLFFPIRCNVGKIKDAIDNALTFAGEDNINIKDWEMGRYCPTPTIIEAAMALYRGHSVDNISRSEAGAINLTKTSETVSEIIKLSRDKSQKSICFVTGVPGAGKTLVGLNIANKHIDKDNDLYSVFLSGNGPLVTILREALTRDKVFHEKENGNKIKKSDAMRGVKSFIQNVHNFRDDCLEDNNPPREHVTLFDEAQRAWNLQQTVSFMQRKKNRPNFKQSEPEFLISCLDRHPDWAVVVCLVGGGQEINIGEAGISEWIECLNRSFPDWNIYISSRLTDSEYGAGKILDQIKSAKNIFKRDELHLSVSMRSFRAEQVSLLIKQLLDIDVEEAQKTLREIKSKYPIVITRDVLKAKQWLKSQARGSERYGMIVSSSAERLKSHAIFVKSPMDPVHWFLNGKDDVRSSYYLEDVATEFDIQGLELDWSCVVWDADFRYTDNGWDCRSFVGNKWNYVKKIERQNYLKNAYRVLLTRARQGMVIVVPSGNINDPTRNPDFYDPIFTYLKNIGFDVI
jgi:KaiC/GvpD/RAD55 family RecA-like ATPase